MTPTVPELLLGNFLCLIEPPPPESSGDFQQGRIAVTGMIALLCAQEAERGVAARVWENGAIREVLAAGVTTRPSVTSSLGLLAIVLVMAGLGLKITAVHHHCP